MRIQRIQSKHGRAGLPLHRSRVLSKGYTEVNRSIRLQHRKRSDGLPGARIYVVVELVQNHYQRMAGLHTPEAWRSTTRQELRCMLATVLTREGLDEQLDHSTHMI